MRKRILAIALALAAALFVVSAQALTVSELLENAAKNTDAAKSYEAKVSAKLTMSAEGETISTDIASTVKYTKDPLRMKMVTTSKVGKEKIKIDTYCQVEDELLAMYMVMDGQVSKMEMELSDEMLAQVNGAAPDNYLKGYKSVEYLGSQKLGGKKVHVIAALLDASLMLGEAQNQLTSMNLDDASADQLLNSVMAQMSDIPVKLFIDAKTQMYTRIEIDLTGLMSGLLKELLGESIEMEYTMAMDYKNYNKVKPFSIPSSVIKKAG